MAKRTCSIDGCGGVHVARGWCKKHYHRWARYGDPLVLHTGGPEVERFWRRVNKNGPVPDARPDLGPCWLWTGGLTAHSYGSFACEPRRPNGHLSSKGAHRYAYEILVGPVPEGLVLDHLCRVKACVCPEHLEPVTNAENLRRGAPNVSALNREKTHCDYGHPFSGENLRIRPKTGERQCRACMRRRREEEAHKATAQRSAVA